MKSAGTPALPPEIPAEIKAHRYQELDSLRGLAAFSVILGHFSLVSLNAPWWRVLQASPGRILVAGHEAVVFFFVLSGFVLCIPFSGRKQVPYLAYLAQRMCRIYLPFAAAVGFALLMDRWFASSRLTGNAWIDQTWTMKPGLWVLASVLSTQAKYATQINTALWTVDLEIRVSIVFPLLYWVVKRSRSVYAVAVIVLVPFGLHSVGVPITNLLSVVTLGLFAIGILFFVNLDLLLTLYRNFHPGLRVLWNVSSILLCWGPMLVISMKTEYGAAHWLQDYLIGLGAVGIMVAAIATPRFRQALRHPVLLRSGALSYSSYLVHGTVLWMLIRVSLGRVPLAVLLPVFLLLTWGVTELFHVAIDAPSVLLGRTVGKALRSRFASSEIVESS
jgi:peptidoglycan/LPS O-acetylase OafA/YrhL